MNEPTNAESRPRRILIDEVCERLGGVTRWHLRNLVTRGKLPACRVSRNVLSFLESDIDDFLERNEVRPAQQPA